MALNLLATSDISLDNTNPEYFLYIIAYLLNNYSFTLLHCISVGISPRVYNVEIRLRITAKVKK